MLSVKQEAVMYPNRHYAKLVDLWQQDGRVEIVEYKSAAGASRKWSLPPIRSAFCLKSDSGDAGVIHQ
jgi:hypothetical protein